MLLWGAGQPGVRDVIENGLFLGKFGFATYSSIEVPRTPGDRGLLYTDGVSETIIAKARSLKANVSGSSWKRRDGSANQVADRLLEELARWSGRGGNEDLDNDITIVTFRVSGE